MRNMWILTILTVSVSATWSLETGPNTTSRSVCNPPSHTTKGPGVIVSRSEHVLQGRNATLQCTNRTWSEMLYTIWKIHLRGRRCNISSSVDGEHLNDCADGKFMGNTTSGGSELHIPAFSWRDEGVYHCETAYNRGSYTANINLSVLVPPRVSAWLEEEGSRRVAVCSAEGAKPAATIVWRNYSNSSSAEEEKERTPEGSFSVKSRLRLTEGAAIGNLSCVVSHLSGTVNKTVEQGGPVIPKNSQVLLIVSMVTVGVILVVLVCVYMLRNLSTLRKCFLSNTPPASVNESKFPPVEEVEEVEPYASYVQRVNSIYNSRADLFS